MVNGSGGEMYKKILAGTTLAFSLAGPALAQDPDGKATPPVAVADSAAVPGPTAVPGPPVVETPETKEEVLYRLGLNGFLRGEGAGNFNLAGLSYQPGHSEGRFLYRVKPYGFWHPTDYLDLHLEGQAYGFTGGGRDDWKVSLYQGYLEAKLPNSDLLALKGGRQEFVYGSTFMLGADAFFNGLTYDGGRLRVRPTSTLTVDLLGGYYTYPSSDGVKGNLAGGYATWTISDGNVVEGYLLRDTGSTDPKSGEQVDSVGVRGVAKLGPLSLEIEPVYQFGEAFDNSKGANGDISAFGGHVDLTGELDVWGLHHKLWLGYAGGSGSRAAVDGVTAKHEFRNRDNDSTIVGDMHVASDLSGIDVAGQRASGLQVYTAGWGTDLTKSLNLSATGHYFQAAAVGSGFSRELGLETDFILTYTISENYSLLLAYDRFFTGRFFRDASGSGGDIQYGYAMLQFNLEKSRPKGPKREKGA